MRDRHRGRRGRAVIRQRERVRQRLADQDRIGRCVFATRERSAESAGAPDNGDIERHRAGSEVRIAAVDGGDRMHARREQRFTEARLATAVERLGAEVGCALAEGHCARRLAAGRRNDCD